MKDTTLIIRAAAFAANKHKNQRRKDTDASPYVNHPLGLARVLTEEGGVTDVETICAALLHDTIEDTDTSAEELEQEFGDAICKLVLEVTDDKALPKAERKLAQIEHAAISVIKLNESNWPIKYAIYGIYPQPHRLTGH